MNTMSDIISRNWRRKTFDYSNKELIDKLKVELFGYIQEAFFDPKTNAPFLSDSDKKNLNDIFYWLIGNCNPVLLSKAPILFGDWGTGKTVILKGILKFINVHYSHDSIIGGISNPIYTLAQDMSNAFKEDDTVLINRMKSCSIIGIDDLGRDAKTVTHYGTECKPFEEILMSRYDKRRIVLITTNMTLEQIGQEYGWHIYDRMRQMSFLVKFEGQSKR